jgi:hypothetical protein
MCPPSWRSARVAAWRLEEFARLRRVRDRLCREYARPTDLVALAREVRLPAGDLGSRFEEAYGETPYACLTRCRTERGTPDGPRGGAALSGTAGSGTAGGGTSRNDAAGCGRRRDRRRGSN